MEWAKGCGANKVDCWQTYKINYLDNYEETVYLQGHIRYELTDSNNKRPIALYYKTS